ncbi:hypothetical protein LTR84_000074 [Exophiala bonariae]|uniref:NADPH--cytochrome P450 reductase n=1 Tax=Exophiala bonariae TaxID=1690606 RepID=A0AAV9NQ91_9EURO|nr:hypothetical protein LTR84_000074 [Exophiala bonariae]
MQFLSHWDLLLIKTALGGLSALYIGSKVQQALRVQNLATSISPHFITSIKSDTGPSLASTRSLRKRLEQTGKRCIIFYGTQTGTAEKFALIMARELTARYNLPSMIADLDDYDFVDLASMESNLLAIFILATYGEGGPTDNAVSFGNFLKQQNAQRGATGEKSMSSLRYAAFGLGSSSYQYFNLMITKVDETLQECGAMRVGSLGRGDDGKGTLEADFINWKEATLNDIATDFALEQVEYHFKPNFNVQEASSSEISDTFLGEPNKNHLNGKLCGPFTARNPYPARIVEARELFTSPIRNSLHLEFDVSDSTITYETGDHLAIWPVNSDLEVERFLKALDLFDKRDTIINITSNDPTNQVPIPPKTTYAAAARYYLDICAPVSRHTLTILATLTAGPDQQVLQRLASDSQLFQSEISDKLLNLAQTLDMAGATASCLAVGFSFFLENIPKLQPRYYSISSSSLVSSKRICVTAVVNSSTTTGSCSPFKGVSTNYLLAIKNEACGSLTESTTIPTHRLGGPRDKHHLPTALIHVRRSRFRLPTNPSTPVIMVGPGTGVAPFRGFVHERAYQARAGRNVGRTVLFYGCRKKDEDFLYKDEWESHSSSFKKGQFSIHTALSREDHTKKVYVQDLIQDHADELKELILNQNAHVYVCGDASQMAKQVFKAFGDIIDGCVQQPSDKYLKSMKATGRWSEDVW